jgi:hypothetical protein
VVQEVIEVRVCGDARSAGGRSRTGPGHLFDLGPGLTQEATRNARTQSTGSRGEFGFRAVAPGSYTVRVELAGFRACESRANVLNANSQLDLGP